ncbi:lysozyme [Actinokineospora spheciospongiae]|uniref:lysozyme n=1 Tax=Actinokineospora spheciospongiae TaxID=909613 RepID=UPI000D7172D8|nr:lysozyme [Actinokineospora spheciospongiae]PWW50891.1 GH25 family lysozyme M1 (1,4-beta-N-acetylmuramidase) [Actinokineospora spheciospongiae]
MKSTARGTRRGLAAALAASAVAIGLFVAVPQANAGQDGDEADRTTNHTMGSQIREHEGVDTRAGDVADPGVQATLSGIDVASYQGNVDWKAHWNAGKRFAYVKATEGLTYKNPYFSQQYTGSYNVGMIRGAYHFALPNVSSGAQQANYFASSGGGWSRDGKTLPGVADLEYNPYGATCYGLSQASMAAWIRDFANTYRARTGRDAVFYTSTSWWSQCVGSAQAFAGTNPLWVARYSSSVGTLPYNWGVWTFWQYTSSPLDTNYFNGAIDRLQAMANG